LYRESDKTLLHSSLNLLMTRFC